MDRKTQMNRKTQDNREKPDWMEREEKEVKERQEKNSMEGKTESKESVPKKGLISKMKMQSLIHQRDQLMKVISRTYEKEVAADVGEETPEMELRKYRQQAKRRRLLQKQQKIEERIRCKKEKGKQGQESDGAEDNRKSKDSEEKDVEDKETEGEKGETDSKESVPKKGVVSKLKMWYLKRQNDQIIKDISRTYEKEVAADFAENTPELEMKKIRQQAKRKELLDKQQKVKEKIRHKTEKGRKKKNQEEGVEEEKEDGLLSRGFSALCSGYVNYGRMRPL
ncbi:golgin subfamily A member 6-like protein 25 [Thunnus thynnus]|uniref:golgin subfamily A member 6-like protein 25 n=1 Tax=Thunnus thynnus TaxID=8237 RepID=UPI003527C26D